jgi:hypothetical protein
MGDADRLWQQLMAAESSLGGPWQVGPLSDVVLPDLPHGAWFIRAEAAGFPAVGAIILVDDEQPDEISLFIPNPRRNICYFTVERPRLDLQVADSQDRPVAGARVRLVDASSSSELAAGPDGSLTLYFDDSSPWALRVEAPGYCPTDLFITEPEDGGAPLPVVLRRVSVTAEPGSAPGQGQCDASTRRQ